MLFPQHCNHVLRKESKAHAQNLKRRSRRRRSENHVKDVNILTRKLATQMNAVASGVRLRSELACDRLDRVVSNQIRSCVCNSSWGMSFLSSKRSEVVAWWEVGGRQSRRLHPLGTDQLLRPACDNGSQSLHRRVFTGSSPWGPGSTRFIVSEDVWLVGQSLQHSGSVGWICTRPTDLLQPQH